MTISRVSHPLRQPHSVCVTTEKIFIKPRHAVGLFILREHYCCNQVSKYFVMFLVLINFEVLKSLLLGM